MPMSREFDLDLLYAALDQKRESQGLSWNGVAREIESRFTKVSPATIKGIRDKQNVEGDGVLQMLLWLGRSPESFLPGISVHKEHDLVEPKNATLRFDMKETYRLLDARRLEEGSTWDQVARQLGSCTASKLRRFKDGGRTSFPWIMRIAHWLDVPVNALTRECLW
jgi:hypothetical protein